MKQTGRSCLFYLFFELRTSGILVAMFNGTFYRFLFGFLTILAITLVVIIVAGSNQN